MWYIGAISNFIVGQLETTCYIPCNPVIMGQLEICSPQLWHCDAKSGYFLIQAMNDNYKIGVISGSHIIPVTETLTPNTPETVNLCLPPIIITLMKYQIFIGNALLIHCRGPSNPDNLDSLCLGFTNLALNVFLAVHHSEHVQDGFLDPKDNKIIK